MLSWTSFILLCAGFAIVSLHETKYYTNNIDEGGELGRRRSQSDRIFLRTDDPFEDVSSSSSDHQLDDRADDIHYYYALGGMADFIQPEDGTIKSISLLGERNSGTRWIYGRVSICH